MKRLIILMAFLTINQLFSQDLKVLYSEKAITPKSFLENLTEEGKINLMKNSKKKYYSLVYHNGKSLYSPTSKLRFYNDSITIIVKGRPVGTNTFINLGVTKNIMYKNLKSHIFVNELTFISKNYSIKDNLPNYNWKITNETKSINGIKVKKALGSFEDNTILAWYAESIPVSDGPYYYSGLSGLILELNYGNIKEFKLEDIKYLKTSKNIDKPKNMTPYISLKEFKNKMEQLH